MSELEKPPIGLVPKWVCDEARRVEILEAMMRYAYSHKNIPPEWIEELVQLSKIDRPSDIPVTVKSNSETVPQCQHLTVKIK